MSALNSIWNGLDWTKLLNLLMMIIPALICIVLHELSHGAVAYALGDDTAKRAGRLTLNPLAHIDWWGLIMMVVFRFGWAKPVPVNMYRFKNPKWGMALTALAGPVSNVIIAAVFMLLYGILLAPLYMRGTRIMFAILEMIEFLPDEAYGKLMRYERYGMIILVILVATGATSGVLSTVTVWAYNKMSFLIQFGFDLVNH